MVSSSVAASRPWAAPASLRRRLASLVYETLLLLGLLTVTWLLPHVLIGTLWQWSSPAWIMWLHLFLLCGIYFSWLWSGGRQTLAMQTWKLHLVDARRGTGLTPRQAALRYLLAWPSLLVCASGWLWALVDRDRQFLHDRLSGTRIIYVPPTRSSPPPSAETARSA